MNDLFLPPELAVLSKEKGFNEPCFGFYVGPIFYLVQIENFDGLVRNSNIEKEGAVAAPLYQQIIDWFYINFKVTITYRPKNNRNFMDIEIKTILKKISDDAKLEFINPKLL